MEPLSANEVHVWYVGAERELPADVQARCLALLSPEEQVRQARFMQAKDRRQFLLGKVLVRSVLSRYRPLAPAAWTFTTTGHGKPTVAVEPPLRFNLSHTDGLVVCAVTPDFDVGIDVESLSRTANLDVARRFFAPAEVAFLESLPEAQRPRVFFHFWTLKESYIKARGLGLSLPLEQFAFSLQEKRPPTIAFTPEMKDDPASWTFHLLDIAPATHQVAVAVHCPTAAALEVKVRSFDLS